MLLVYLKNGECIEVEAAIKAEVREYDLVCLDDLEQVVSRFRAVEVEVYSTNPTVVTALEEEVCEDLTTIPANSGPNSGYTLPDAPLP